MSVLDEIIVGVREDLAERQERLDTAALERAVADAANHAPALPVMDAFRRPGVSVIAEVKRASPSKGALADIPDPAALAGEYAAGGADAISVLTEARRFGGSLADLEAVRAQVRTPLLRKDFVVTRYQLLEGRAAGADLALLIVAALDQPTLLDLLGFTRDLGMTALVEVHDRDELLRAVDAGADLLGVNARNLKTLEVDPHAFARLAVDIPDGVVRVAESGIADADAVARHVDEGADVVLVGEALVKDGDPRAAVGRMKTAGRHATARPEMHPEIARETDETPSEVAR